MNLTDKVKFLSITVVLAILVGGITYAEDWKVDQKWNYKHEGPRPFSDPSTSVSDEI